MGGSRLLLVEDDRRLGAGIRAGLSHAGYSVEWVMDGGVAERSLRTGHFDLVVLDLGLPSRSGLEVLRDLRARGDSTPVLILTGRDAIADRVCGLDSGGDDYLVKPFDLDELVARLRALCRRSGEAGQRLRCGEVSLDCVQRTAYRGEEAIRLSPHEFILLRLLMEDIGAVIPRTTLEEALYGSDTDVESNTVEVHIHFLRRKLGARFIRTVRGVGYTVGGVQ